MESQHAQQSLPPLILSLKLSASCVHDPAVLSHPEFGAPAVLRWKPKHCDLFEGVLLGVLLNAAVIHWSFAQVLKKPEAKKEMVILFF